MTAGSRSSLLTRRGFMQAASGVMAAQALLPAMHALAPVHAASGHRACRIVDGGIDILRARGDAWEREGHVACDAPSALALDRLTRTLYVAHGTASYQHLPTGSIGSYRLQADSGELSLLHREGLSLACAHPDSIAVSPDGKLLIVASRRAGILNVMPLDEQGIAGPVTATRKEMRWPIPGDKVTEDVSLHLKFVGERTFVVIDTLRQTSTQYRCSEDEIALPAQGDLLPLETARNSPIIGPDPPGPYSNGLIWV